MAAMSRAMAATPARPALVVLMNSSVTSLLSAAPMGTSASGRGPWPVHTMRPFLATMRTSAGRFTLITSSWMRSGPCSR